ncbi:MAG: hypothetical protein RI959_578 [Pseudomonadota bacterium]
MATTLIFRRTGESVWPKLATLAVWLAVGVSSSYWGLQLWGKAAPVAVPVVPQPTLVIDQAAVARALGAAKVQPGVVQVAGSAPKVVLLGVAGDAKGQGVALLSVDGQAPKPYRVGVEVTDGWRLESVAGRAAVLAAGDKAAPTHRLELPPLKQ